MSAALTTLLAKNVLFDTASRRGFMRRVKVHVGVLPLSRGASTAALGGSFPAGYHNKLEKSLRKVRDPRLCALRIHENRSVKRAEREKLDPAAMANLTSALTNASPSNQHSHTSQVMSDLPNDSSIDGLHGDKPVARAPLELFNATTPTTSFVSARLDAIQRTRSQDPFHETSSPLEPPRQTVFSDELDAIETEFLNDRQKYVKQNIAPFKNAEVYDTNPLDRAAQDVSDIGLLDASDSQAAVRAAVRKHNFVAQYPKRAYIRGVARLPLAAEPRKCDVFHNDYDGRDDQSCDENPHFPSDAAPSTSRKSASDSSLSPLSTSPSVSYDAYVTRPHDNTIVTQRDVEYWDDFENRSRVESYARAQREAVAQEYLRESPVDNVRHEHHSNVIRMESMLFHRAYPANESIQDSYIRIAQIVPDDGSEHITIPNEEQYDITISEGRAIARQHGLDLIRMSETFSPEHSEQGMVGICCIANHNQMMRRMVKFKLESKGGIQPQKNPSCVEVPFRGGTHPHAIRFKSIGIAKLLVRRTPIRINLTDFGTPREGFPIFQTILDEIKQQCLPLKAFHRAGVIQSNYNEIFCILHPSTARNPKFGVEHPSPADLHRSRDQRIMENEMETYFDEFHNQRSAREALQYSTKLADGTAWADRDEGLSLRRQRSMKVMLGYLPKGNQDIYMARGDVDVPRTFRASHPTSTELWNYPRESNLEQAGRASLVLGKRMSMDVSDMHARGETEENPSTVERFYYKVSGPALNVGAMKESLGLKSNRKKAPGLAAGWATLGVRSSNGEGGQQIRK